MLKLISMKRTDLANEFTDRRAESVQDGHIKRTCVRLDKKAAAALGKSEGLYCTVECRAVTERRRDLFDSVACELSTLMREMSAGAESVLAIGLGNPNMTADSLGAKVCDRLIATRHLKSEGGGRLCVLTPNVLGVTGIESFDVVAGVAQRIKPDLAVAIDSLAAAATSRIASAFQISDSGITPGSGVSNHRERLSRQSLGLPVLSVGVPLVVYASTIIADATGMDKCDVCAEDGDMIVTPKDIDLYVDDCAYIVARAINDCFVF